MKKNHFLLIASLPFLSFSLGYLLIQYVHAPAILSTPSLVGLPLPQAARLCQPHLALRVIQSVTDAQLPDGTVLRQMPIAGQKIKAHQIISVIISAQPPHNVTPDYRGKSLEDCTTDAQKQNLTLQIAALASTLPKNTCIAQSPAPGKPLGTPPMLTIYISAPESDCWIVPDYKKRTVAQIQEYACNDSITLQIISSNPHASIGGPNKNSCVVVDQRPLPGSVIKGNNKHTISLYVQPLTPEII